jgi:hypothetical protein
MVLDSSHGFSVASNGGAPPLSSQVVVQWFQGLFGMDKRRVVAAPTDPQCSLQSTRNPVETRLLGHARVGKF